MKKLLHQFRVTLMVAFSFLYLNTSLLAQLTPACSPTYTNGAFSWNINQITIGDFSQSIASSNHDYTAQSFSVEAGAVNTISLTSVGWCSVGIAADFDNDGDFSDDGEVLHIATYEAGNPNIYTFDFTIPEATLPGNYRFRAWNIKANSGDGNPAGSPCGTYQYGSWFDVTMEVTSAATCQTPSGLAISDITSTSANATWVASTSDPDSYDWKIHYAGDDPD